LILIARLALSRGNAGEGAKSCAALT